MALADMDDLLAKSASPAQTLKWLKTTPGTGERQDAAMWRAAWNVGSIPAAGAAPAAAATCSDSTAGGIVKSDAGAGRQVLVGGNSAVGTLFGGGFQAGVRPALLIDRLSHAGGLVGNVNTVQTTNLPTAALPRYTSAVGVMAAVEVMTQPGSSSVVMNTAANLIYTNEAGVGGRSAWAWYVQAATTSGQWMNYWIAFGLDTGDLGVKSVESLQFSTAVASGAAGNFAVVLYKPLNLIMPDNEGQFNALQIGGFGEPIQTGACLQMLHGLEHYTSATITTLDLTEC